MHFLLLYDLAPDYLERRSDFRNEHLGLAWQAQSRGELVLAGPLADPVDQAVLLFQGESPEVARAFALSDPYVKNGLVKAWRVRPWTTVVGEQASTPVRPA
ncbi:MAG: YciI family protein [Burkholderiaceae bacterium]|nr:YciI family protein [Burkholderiaceae bacterium]